MGRRTRRMDFKSEVPPTYGMIWGWRENFLRRLDIPGSDSSSSDDSDSPSDSNLFDDLDSSLDDSFFDSDGESYCDSSDSSGSAAFYTPSEGSSSHDAYSSSSDDSGSTAFYTPPEDFSPHNTSSDSSDSSGSAAFYTPPEGSSDDASPRSSQSPHSPSRGSSDSSGSAPFYTPSEGSSDHSSDRSTRRSSLSSHRSPHCHRSNNGHNRHHTSRTSAYSRNSMFSEESDSESDFSDTTIVASRPRSRRQSDSARARPRSHTPNICDCSSRNLSHGEGIVLRTFHVDRSRKPERHGLCYLLTEAVCPYPIDISFTNSNDGITTRFQVPTIAHYLYADQCRDNPILFARIVTARDAAHARSLFRESRLDLDLQINVPRWNLSLLQLLTQRWDKDARFRRFCRNVGQRRIRVLPRTPENDRFAGALEGFIKLHTTRRRR